MDSLCYLCHWLCEQGSQRSVEERRKDGSVVLGRRRDGGDGAVVDLAVVEEDSGGGWAMERLWCEGCAEGEEGSHAVEDVLG